MDETKSMMNADINEKSVQQKIAPIIVFFFSLLILWPMGIIDIQIAIILFNISLIYPLWRMFDRKSLEEFGIKLHGFNKAIKENWFLIISPIVVVNPFAIVIQWIFPALSEHVIGRVPINLSASPLIVLTQVVILGPLIEEALFRGFLQRYTAFFAPKYAAIIFASVVFAFSHWASGDILFIALDLIFIFTRGCIYGLIYARTENALISFIPHALVNLPFW